MVYSKMPAGDSLHLWLRPKNILSPLASRAIVDTTWQIFGALLAPSMSQQIPSMLWA